MPRSHLSLTLSAKSRWLNQSCRFQLSEDWNDQIQSSWGHLINAKEMGKSGYVSWDRVFLFKDMSVNALVLTESIHTSLAYQLVAKAVGSLVLLAAGSRISLQVRQAQVSLETNGLIS